MFLIFYLIYFRHIILSHEDVEFYSSPNQNMIAVYQETPDYTLNKQNVMGRKISKAACLLTLVCFF